MPKNKEVKKKESSNENQAAEKLVTKVSVNKDVESNVSNAYDSNSDNVSSIEADSDNDSLEKMSSCNSFDWEYENEIFIARSKQIEKN